jgi:hypothetical protein
MTSLDRAKISRFAALGDKPGHPTGFVVLLANGDLLLSSAHPASTLILHAVSQHGGRLAR